MTTDDTRIEADPEVPLIRITRKFAAPPASVFRAHVDPDLIVRWLGARAPRHRDGDRHLGLPDRWRLPL